jgi:hypothetical protein
MDEGLAGRAADEGVDHVGVGDVGELIVLLGEVLDVLPEGLIGPLPAVAEVPRVPGPGVHALEVPDEDEAEVSQQRMMPGSSCSSQALVELDRSKGRYWMAKSSSDPSALMARR